jgi:hypothetical protein
MTVFHVPKTKGLLLRQAVTLNTATRHMEITQTSSHYVIKAMLKARRKNNLHEIPSRRQLLHLQQSVCNTPRQDA